MTTPAQPNHETLAQTVARLRELMAKAPRWPEKFTSDGDGRFECQMKSSYALAPAT